jgi:hypothetical protein
MKTWKYAGILIALVLLLAMIPVITGQAQINSRFGTLDLEDVTITADEANILDGVTATYLELNYLDITAAGTAQASKALVLDASKQVDSLTVTSALRYRRPLKYVTAAYDSLTAVESGSLIILRPLAAKSTVVLPPAAKGLEFTFMVADADSARIRASTVTTADSLIATSGAAAVYTTSVAGTFTATAADTTRWFITAPVGTWTNY